MAGTVATNCIHLDFYNNCTIHRRSKWNPLYWIGLRLKPCVFDGVSLMDRPKPTCDDKTPRDRPKPPSSGSSARRPAKPLPQKPVAKGA